MEAVRSPTLRNSVCYLLKGEKQYHKAVLEAKRNRKHFQAEKLLTAALEEETNLLAQMKKIRKGCNTGTELPSSVESV